MIFSIHCVRAGARSGGTWIYAYSQGRSTSAFVHPTWGEARVFAFRAGLWQMR